MRATAGFALFLFAAAAGASPAEGDGAAAAAYAIRLVSVAPLRLHVTATLPVDGERLDMATTRPAGIPELDASGWAGLVSRIRVTDAQGRAVRVTPAGDRGWTFERPIAGTIGLDYQVDFGPLQRRAWPAQREAVFGETDFVSLIGRSLFVTTSAMGAARVDFDLPPPWNASAPWLAAGKNAFDVATPADLVDNLIVLSHEASQSFEAGGFRLRVATTGPWEGERAEIERVLRAVVPRLADLAAGAMEGEYLVVLLPEPERGGESFRGSFAMTLDEPPSAANRARWANTIAHEVFHSWNGWRLRGADYAWSQWFQEGFTEYAANAALAASGVGGATTFRQALARHVQNYAKLATPLAKPGTRKGPPLYSGGALVAFAWDATIRRQTGGARDLSDFFGALWEETGGGRVPYTRVHIERALRATAEDDWRAFLDAYVEERGELPLAAIFSDAGLLLTDDPPRVDVDPAASCEAAAIGAALGLR